MIQKIILLTILLLFSVTLTRFEPVQNNLAFLYPSSTPANITLSPTPTGIIGATRTPTPTIEPGTLSNSKIGIFYLNATDQGRAMMNRGPRVIKVIDPQSNGDLMQLIRDYKSLFSGGIVVMRVWEGTPDLDMTTMDPTTAANTFWSQVLQPALNKLSAQDKALIDYLSGPNEFEKLPWKTQGYPWINSFFTILANRIKNDGGIKPILGDLTVGFPQDINQLQDLLPSLCTLQSLEGVFSYHAYTNTYSMDINSADAQNWSLRFKRFYSFFESHTQLCDLTNLPIVLTEGGAVTNALDNKSGYLTGNVDVFKTWLGWFDDQIINDNRVLGVTLFQSGNTSDWSFFNLDQISSWFSTYLTNK